jgi:4-hydroxy-tetrahydrodipicolinate reductase
MSADRKYRVIQWATGRVGLPALRGIIDHPDLELVGLYVTSEAKDGRDAGELCGAGPVGVRATRDVDAILGLDADCVCYGATDVGRVDAVIDDLCTILASGKNVVNNSITRLVWPAGMEPDVIARLQKACAKGDSTLYNTGIHPGVVSDAMLFALTNLSQRIDMISAAELLDCSSYDPPVISALGFGKTIEEDAATFDTAILHYYWGPVVRALAESFDLELDEIRRFRRPELVEGGFTTSAGLPIPPNTIGAIHYGLEGVVDGTVRIVAENYEKIRPDIAPDGWPMFPIHNDEQAGGYRILVKGIPDMQLDLAFGGADPLTDVLIGTGMRAVNSIAAVCQAPSGIIGSFEELPHVRGFMAAADAKHPSAASAR